MTRGLVVDKGGIARFVVDDTESATTALLALALEEHPGAAELLDAIEESKSLVGLAEAFQDYMRQRDLRSANRASILTSRELIHLRERLAAARGGGNPAAEIVSDQALALTEIVFDAVLAEWERTAAQMSAEFPSLADIRGALPPPLMGQSGTGLASAKTEGGRGRTVSKSDMDALIAREARESAGSGTQPEVRREPTRPPSVPASPRDGGSSPGPGGGCSARIPPALASRIRTPEVRGILNQDWAPQLDEAVRSQGLDGAISALRQQNAQHQEVVSWARQALSSSGATFDVADTKRAMEAAEDAILLNNFMIEVLECRRRAGR